MSNHSTSLPRVDTGRAPSKRGGFGADDHVSIAFNSTSKHWEAYLLINTATRPKRRGHWREGKGMWESKYTVASFDKEKVEEARRYRSMIGHLFTNESMESSPYTEADAFQHLATLEERAEKRAVFLNPTPSKISVRCPCGHVSNIGKAWWSRTGWAACRGCGIYIQKDTGALNPHGWYARVLGEAAGDPTQIKEIAAVDPEKHQPRIKARQKQVSYTEAAEILDRLVPAVRQVYPAIVEGAKLLSAQEESKSVQVAGDLLAFLKHVGHSAWKWEDTKIAKLVKALKA